MGVLNVTPDSFSDGGRYLRLDRAIDAALAMERAGADLLDLGGESTRPGSEATPVAEELARILPVLEALRGRLKIPISIDTRKSSVAEIALGAGAELVNDVSGLRYDPRLAAVAARFHAPLILMHMRGVPASMQKGPFARNVLADVRNGLRRSIAIARAAGNPRRQIVLDPGIGFGKTVRAKLRTAGTFAGVGAPGLPDTGGHFAQRIFVRNTRSVHRQTGPRRRTRLCHRGHRSREHSAGSAHRARA